MYKTIVWPTLDEMFQVLNENCNYLVLRNYESLNELALSQKEDDIDVLCDDTVQFVRVIGAVPINKNDNIHYVLNTNRAIIRIDVRCVDDGYYDENWARHMLDNRIMHESRFYVPDTENYYYSLLFHGIYHKDTIKKEYVIRLMNIARSLGKEFDERKLKYQLDSYMKEKKYVDTGYRSLK